MEEAERFSVPDDLKDKIMKKIEKQNNYATQGRF